MFTSPRKINEHRIIDDCDGTIILFGRTLPPVLTLFPRISKSIGFGLQIKGGIRDEFIPVLHIESDMKYEPNDATEWSHRQQYSSELVTHSVA